MFPAGAQAEQLLLTRYRSAASTLQQAPLIWELAREGKNPTYFPCTKADMRVKSIELWLRSKCFSCDQSPFTSAVMSGRSAFLIVRAGADVCTSLRRLELDDT